jgi:hypothetical protein
MKEQVDATDASGSSLKARVSARRAWVALACTPLALIVGFFVPYWVAALIDAPFAAWPPQTLTFLQALVLFLVTGIVVVGLPVLAFVFALGPARSGSPSGKAALIVSGLLILVLLWFCAVTFASPSA